MKLNKSLFFILATSSRSRPSAFSSIHEISNGFCTFSPTTTKGKWIFRTQTFCLSILPVLLLILQNGITFSVVLKAKNEISFKDNLVTESRHLRRFIINLQNERAGVSLAVFMNKKLGKLTDLSNEYGMTDKSIETLSWRKFGKERIFDSKLRFQIRLDDFR